MVKAWKPFGAVSFLLVFSGVNPVLKGEEFQLAEYFEPHSNPQAIELPSLDSDSFALVDAKLAVPVPIPSCYFHPGISGKQDDFESTVPTLVDPTGQTDWVHDQHTVLEFANDGLTLNRLTSRTARQEFEEEFGPTFGFDQVFW